jgi:hypothetical protein
MLPLQVGPYCVFDDFRLPPSPQPSPPSASASRGSDASQMEDPIMTSDFPFGTMRGPWMSSAADDIPMPATADHIASWNEWMQFDPAAASQNTQSVDTKPASAQGSSCPQPGHQPSPHFNNHSQAESLQPHHIPTSTPMFTQTNGVPFTFGQAVDMPQAFDFNTPSLSPPLTGDSQQQNGFYSPPMWQQQQQQSQQHQRQQADHGLFSPPNYDNTGFTPMPPAASTPSLHHSPSSLNNGRASSSSSHSSPEPATGSSKKRKSPSDSEEPEMKFEKGQPPKKTAHNMIEKRYRTNLNDKIAALRDSKCLTMRCNATLTNSDVLRCAQFARHVKTRW